MKRNILQALILIIAATIFFMVPDLQAAPLPGACTLLAKADIQAALGKPVGDGKLNTKANAAVGYPCEYKVGDYGTFSILIKTAGPGENADKVMSELKKGKITVAETPGVGDRSFFANMGYGMIQLNTFKGSSYLIITMLVPGSTEAAQKNAAITLMRKALAKL